MTVRLCFAGLALQPRPIRQRREGARPATALSRETLPEISLADRQTDHALELAVRQGPEAHRFVGRGGRKECAGGVDANVTSRDNVLEDWISKTGAKLVFLSPAKHDRLVALASHLPQMLSTALGSALADEPEAAKVAGPGAMDMTRLAMSSYEIWHDILATNAEPIEAALDVVIGKLEELRASLRSTEMEKEFERASKAARALR